MKATKSQGPGNGEQRELCPADTWPAVLVAMIDLGHQEKRNYDRPSETEWKHRIYLAWEIQVETDGPAEGETELKRYYLCNDYTLSLNEAANLRDILKTGGVKVADDADCDIMQALGKPYQITVGHKTSKAGREFDFIEKVAAASAATRKAIQKPTVEPVAWQMSYGDGVPDVPWAPWLFGRSLEDVIKASKEWGEWSRGKDGTSERQMTRSVTLGASQPAQQTPATATPARTALASSDTPPPRKKAAQPASEPKPEGRVFWVVQSEDNDPVKMTELELCDWMKAKSLDARVVQVCLLGTESWLTAFNYGMAGGLPF